MMKMLVSVTRGGEGRVGEGRGFQAAPLAYCSCGIHQRCGGRTDRLDVSKY